MDGYQANNDTSFRREGRTTSRQLPTTKVDKDQEEQQPRRSTFAAASSASMTPPADSQLDRVRAPTVKFTLSLGLPERDEEGQDHSLVSPRRMPLSDRSDRLERERDRDRIDHSHQPTAAAAAAAAITTTNREHSAYNQLAAKPSSTLTRALVSPRMTQSASLEASSELGAKMNGRGDTARKVLSEGSFSVSVQQRINRRSMEMDASSSMVKWSRGLVPPPASSVIDPLYTHDVQPGSPSLASSPSSPSSAAASIQLATATYSNNPSFPPHAHEFAAIEAGLCYARSECDNLSSASSESDAIATSRVSNPSKEGALRKLPGSSRPALLSRNRVATAPDLGINVASVTCDTTRREGGGANKEDRTSTNDVSVCPPSRCRFTTAPPSAFGKIGEQAALPQTDTTCLYGGPTECTTERFVLACSCAPTCGRRTTIPACGGERQLSSC